MVNEIRRLKATQQLNDSRFNWDLARRVIGRHLKARQCFPRESACLLDSLALFHVLAKRKLFTSLVFGVIAEPFEAHCWLQFEDVVLNDSFESTAACTPIMVI
jgi:hypothetical protein